jgi:hypothetical protein
LGEFAIVPCCCCFEFGSVWSSVVLFGVLGLSGLDRSDGLTDVDLLCGSHQVSPAGTGLTGGSHRPDRCRSVRLEFCVPLRSRVCEVESWFLGLVALQWLRGLGQLW